MFYGNEKNYINNLLIFKIIKLTFIVNIFMKNSFSTFEAAEYCDTTMISIIRWVKDGKIKSYRTPGGHRRIPRQALFEFMDKYNIPIPEKVEPVRKRILIVDDDFEVRESLFLFLSGDQYNFELAVAKDGYEAGIKVMQFKPDVIILDLMMPNIDGFEVCERIKSDPLTQNIKILVLTAYDDPDNIDKANKKGADKILVKPAGTEELIGEIKLLLHK